MGITSMTEPLTKQQQLLRGRKICDMSVEQLRVWINACERMEEWVGHNKVRRSWKESRIKAEAELERRLQDEA
jgi:hypothetical protein